MLTRGKRIFNSADRLVDAETSYLENADPLLRRFLKMESSLLLRRAIGFWFWIRFRKIIGKYSQASYRNANYHGGK